MRRGPLIHSTIPSPRPLVLLPPASMMQMSCSISDGAEWKNAVCLRAARSPEGNRPGSVISTFLSGLLQGEEKRSACCSAGMCRISLCGPHTIPAANWPPAQRLIVTARGTPNDSRTSKRSSPIEPHTNRNYAGRLEHSPIVFTTLPSRRKSRRWSPPT